jgi:hypothetical protein
MPAAVGQPPPASGGLKSSGGVSRTSFRRFLVKQEKEFTMLIVDIIRTVRKPRTRMEDLSGVETELSEEVLRLVCGGLAPGDVSGGTCTSGGGGPNEE